MPAPSTPLERTDKGSRPTTPSTPSRVPTAVPLPASPSSYRPAATPRSKSTGPPARETAQLAAALQHEGFSANILLRLTTETVAKSLTWWYHDVVQDLQSKPLVSSILHAASASSGTSPATPPPYTDDLLALVGTPANLHWLTRLVLSHIFLSPPTESNSSKDNRPEVLARWIEIANICRKAQDECSYKAIKAALSMPAVVRLEAMWKQVPTEFVDIVRVWNDDSGVYLFLCSGSVCCGV